MILKSFLTISLLFFCACSSNNKRKVVIAKAPTSNVERKAPISNVKKNAVIANWSTTASGLQYKVIKQGDGDRPKASNNVTVHYEGTFLDGRVFDSSYRRGQPTSFPLNRVIPGWTEGLQLMRTGSTYIFRIPPNLAYGPNGSGPIPGNSTLIFKVELISFR